MDAGTPGGAHAAQEPRDRLSDRAGWLADIAMAIIYVAGTGVWLSRLPDDVSLAGAPHGRVAVAAAVVALALLGAGLAVRRHRPLVMLGLATAADAVNQWALASLGAQLFVWPFVVFAVARFHSGRRAIWSLVLAAVACVAPAVREPAELAKQSPGMLLFTAGFQFVAWWVLAATPYALGRLVRSHAFRGTAAAAGADLVDH